MRLIMPPHIDPSHPIATQEYAVYTPPIYEMIETMGNWINRKETGGYVSSPPRFGKSRAIKWFVRDALEERFNTAIPLVIWSRRTDMQVTEGEFWYEILLASGFIFAELKQVKSKTKFRDEVLNRMIGIARSAGSNYVVLVIDEAQEMTIKEWKWLLGLQNHLDQRGFRFSIFSIGTQQLGYKHDYLAKTGNSHISSRFLVANSKFFGLRDEAELKYVLEGYDRESEWPDNSGISYFQYFSPENFKHGHRLASCSEILWAVFCELLPKDNKSAASNLLAAGIPMKYVALSIEEAMWKLAEGEEWEKVTSSVSWNNIVDGTGYVGHMTAISSFR